MFTIARWHKVLAAFNLGFCGLIIAHRFGRYGPTWDSAFITVYVVAFYASSFLGLHVITVAQTVMTALDRENGNLLETNRRLMAALELSVLTVVDHCFNCGAPILGDDEDSDEHLGLDGHPYCPNCDETCGHYEPEED